MKKNKIFLFVICIITLSNYVYSQTYEPSQVKFNYNGLSQYLSADSSYFQQKEFIIGCHWDALPKISKALLLNQRDGSFGLPNSRDYMDSCYMFLRAYGNTHFVDADILNARGIQYEPTLELNKSNPTKLVKRIGDTTRPVFGFLNRLGRIPTNPIDTNFNRLIIDSISLVNQVILSEPWPSILM